MGVAIDVLVNNAGHAAQADARNRQADEVAAASWTRTSTAAFQVGREAALPHGRARPGGGKIVNVGSLDQRGRARHRRALRGGRRAASRC